MSADSGLAISVRGLSKSFKGHVAVKDCSIDVPYGAIYGFMGPNGGGKTTTIRMLCGLLTADAGEGTCLGFDIRRQAAAIKRQAGYMPQKFGLYEDLTIKENLEFIARLYEMENPETAAKESLRRLGLEHRADQLVGYLSGGWKQRLALAACIIHSPRLLLLDEPTAGVDPRARREFWDEIHEFAAQGTTILVATHYMDEAERCHLIGYIMNGRLLVHGQAREVVKQSGLVTWRISAPDPEAIRKEIQGKPGVEMVTIFGGKLHLAGTDIIRLKAVVSRIMKVKGVKAEKLPPTLEDVFVHTMAAAKNRDGEEST